MRSPARTTSSPGPDPAARVAALDIAGVGRVCFWTGGSLWIGHTSGRTAPHAHHAIQVSLALDDGGSFFLGEPGEPEVERRAAIVVPRLRHRFDGRGGTVAQVFTEPETALGHALLERFPGTRVQPLPLEIVSGPARALGEAFHRGEDDEALVRLARDLAGRLAGASPAQPPVSSRIEAVIDHLAAVKGAPVSLAQAAALVHLSPGRFRHLFVAETGTTFRAYALWVRIQHAIGAMMAGRSWTEAAHDAGFADSAHLSRTFRRMFGVSPTMIVREENRAARRK